MKDLGDVIRGYSLGIMRDITKLEAPCYQRSDKVADRIEELLYSLKHPDFHDFLKPFVVFNQLLVETSDQMIECFNNELID